MRKDIVDSKTASDSGMVRYRITRIQERITALLDNTNTDGIFMTKIDDLYRKNDQADGPRSFKYIPHAPGIRICTLPNDICADIATLYYLKKKYANIRANLTIIRECINTDQRNGSLHIYQNIRSVSDIIGVLSAFLMVLFVVILWMSPSASIVVSVIILLMLIICSALISTGITTYIRNTWPNAYTVIT